MSRNKAKGTAAESMVVNFLQHTYWPHAERRALAGALDKGDITGTPGLAWEVKAASRLDLPAWIRESETERVNARADYCTLVVKPSGYGVARTGLFYALMELNRFHHLFDTNNSWLIPQSYSFYTTIRRMPVDTALSVLTGYTLQPERRFRWVEYPKFVVTTLQGMCEILARAGYGTVDEVPG